MSSCSIATKWQHNINPMATPWEMNDEQMQQRHEVATYHQSNGNALG
jgi:hypothetical protein